MAEISESERRLRLRQIMDDLNLTEAEAEVVLAIELGESDGDVIEVDDDDE